MSKNMTRKGLALGAGLALVATGLAVPANANGLADKSFVSLLPNQGTQYTVLADNFFDLKANATSSIATAGNLKFLVEDTTSKTAFDADVNGTTVTDTVTGRSASVVTNAGVTLPAATGTISVTAANPAVVTYGGHTLAVNDTIVISGVTATTQGDADTRFNKTHRVSAVSGDTFTLDGVNNSSALAGVSYAGLTIKRVSSAVSTTSTTFYMASQPFFAGNSITGAGFSDTVFNEALIVSATTANSFTVTSAARTVTANVDDNDTSTWTRAVSTALELRQRFVNNTLGTANLLPTGVAVQQPTGWDGANGRKSATDGTYVVNTGVASSTDDKVLRLVNTGSDTLSVRVTAWVDANGNGLIDPTEYTSEARTVVFTKLSEAVFTTTLSAMQLATSSVAEGFVNLGSAFNHSMVGNTTQQNRVNIRFQKNASASGEQVVATTFDATSGLLRAVTSGGDFSSPGVGTYNAQARYGDPLASVGSAAFQTVSAGTVNIANTISELQGTNSATYARASATTANVKTGTTSVTLSTEVLEGSNPARAGIPARVTVTRQTLAALSTVAGGGKTLAATGVSSITFDGATNADGEVVVTLTATGARNDSVTVLVEVLDEDAWRTASNTLTWVNAAITPGTGALIDVDTVGASAVRNVAKGGSLTLNYMVRDTFGQPFVAAGYRVVFSATSVTGGGTVNGSAAVTNGRASFTFTDNTVTATGQYDVVATLQKLNDAGDTFVADGNTATTRVVVGAPAVSAVSTTTAMLATTTESNRKILQTVAYKSGDGRAINITWPYTTDATPANNYFLVTGKVTASTGAPVPGQAVVVSAPGAALTTAHNSATAVHGVGTLTVYADANGDYSVYVYSNKSGKIDITVTAGTATRATVAYFKKPELTAGRTINIDAPTAVVRGSTLTIKSTLLDKFGNGVDAASGSSNQSMTITYTGPGLLVSTPTAYVDGALQFGVLLGANDSGTATVTISVYTGVDKITSTKTITVGNAPAATTGKVNVGSFNGKLVVYAQNLDGKRISWKVGGNWGKATAVGNTLNRFDRPTPRRGVTVSVNIYVDGVLTLTKSVVTR